MSISEILAGGTIPLAFFPDWLAGIAKHLPFRYIGDFPYRIYSNSIALNEGISLLFLSILLFVLLI